MNQSPAIPVYSRGAVLVTPVRDETLLAKAYLKFEAERLLETIWHNGVWTLREFLDWALQPDRVMLGAYQTEARLDQDVGLIGLGWVNSFERFAGFAKAEVGFGYFRKPSLWNKITGTRLMLDMFFSAFPVDFLFGFTPDQNPVAIGFAKRAGFEVVAKLPNYCAWQGNPANAVVLTLSRWRWESHRGGK